MSDADNFLFDECQENTSKKSIIVWRFFLLICKEKQMIYFIILYDKCLNIFLEAFIFKTNNSDLFI